MKCPVEFFDTFPYPFVMLGEAKNLNGCLHVREILHCAALRSE
jgi:hypothetical protein